jgi:hypothetical protein
MPKPARTSIHPRSSMCGVLSVKERNDKLAEPHPVPTQDRLCPSVVSAGRTEQAGTGARAERVAARQGHRPAMRFG